MPWPTVQPIAVTPPKPISTAPTSWLRRSSSEAKPSQRKLRAGQRIGEGAGHHAQRAWRCRSSGAATCRSTASAAPGRRPWARRSSSIRACACWWRSTPSPACRGSRRSRGGRSGTSRRRPAAPSATAPTTCAALPRKRLSLNTNASSAARTPAPAASSAVPRRQAAGLRQQRGQALVLQAEGRQVDGHRVEPGGAPLRRTGP